MCFSSKYLVLPYEPFRDHISFHLLCYVFFHNILPCIFKLRHLKIKPDRRVKGEKKDLTVVSFCHALFYLQTTITKLLNLLYVFLVFVGFCFVYFNISYPCVYQRNIQKRMKYQIRRNMPLLHVPALKWVSVLFFLLVQCV